MQIEEHEIINQLVIPPQPEVLRVVVEESRKPEPDLSRVARHIARDASVAGGVLQVINSPLFRCRREISSIPHAVNLLGFKRVYALVRTVALRNAMADYPGVDEFWKRGVHVAEATARAAKLIKRPDLLDEAHLIGLFHMVGIPALRSVVGEAYDPLLDRVLTTGWSMLPPQEARLFGITHPRVGALITQRWHVHPAVVHAIDQQYAVEHLSRLDALHVDTPDLVVILKLALRATAAVDASLMTFAEWNACNERLLDYLALPDPSALEALVDAVLMQD
ncbi:HD-like signal output (HDOD) domain, no enzymatic activity [Ectothiorhodospira magna]|uniref:HD-like signal output (HDOD) domain, no enzymatic activity n=1 Tax=Ectothiorhodospira magna TaxID=867345 RepID=A0A1H8YZH5_9GAMM|nr:HDOD domain-containing protein [Ectothiorhodospira magna]SEP57600.1 HD-like signal output (HDOD) domain, no enzymatic activity [Ectothiorhodospira magna]